MPAISPQLPAARTLPAPAPRTLGWGSTGADVRQLQQSLRANGFDPGPADGVYGPLTKAAVVKFQVSRGLSSDGVVGPETWGRLRAAPRPAVPAAAGSPSGRTGVGGATISPAGREQMNRLVQYARAHNSGQTAGDCFNYVWRYMTSSGYGKLHAWGDLPNMPSTYARNFADYMNSSPSHLAEAGLQRLDTALSPPITNPHDPRVPPGAVVVVAPGSTGTRHPTAGDITVRGTAPGEFINDGPMGRWMGTQSSWRGKVLGIYVPR